MNPDRADPDLAAPEVRVAIVILTYNGRALIDACLDAVRTHTVLDGVQVVVVDNASTDGTADHVAAQHPWVHLVRNGKNLGFAGGVNSGIQAVHAGSYVLLNSDALVTPGWLARLERTAAGPQVGIAGALEVHADGTPRWGPALPPIDERVPEDRETTSFACALIRREVVDRIGFLDHGYFMYHEDWDYCHRAKAAGFRIVFDPAVVVVHPGEGSFKTQVPAWKARIRTTSRLRYQTTHWPAGKLLRTALREPLLAGYWAKNGLLPSYLAGVRSAWAARKEILRRRADPAGFVPANPADPPMHVAMALPWPSWNRAGGTERHVHELACALTRRGVHVTVIVPAPAAAPPPGLPYNAVIVDSARMRAARALRQRLPAGRTLAVRAFDKAFNVAAERRARRLGADVLHRHFVYEVGFRPAMPLVYTLHNGNLPVDDGPVASGLVAADQRRRMRGLRRAIEDADQVVCVSGHVRDSVVGRLGAKAKAVVIDNGCSQPPPTVTKAEARARLGLRNERVALFIGHLWRHKRVLRLLPLLDDPTCHLALIGTGELEPELRAHAAKEPRLRVLGFVDEEQKRLWLRAADVLVLPSGTFEGNPLVLLEALRSGTPVYGTMEAWMPESLRKYGRFGDDVRLAFDAMAIDASPAIAEVPGWDEVAEQTLAVYREALSGFGRANA